MSADFLTDLHVSLVEDGRWRLDATLKYWSEVAWTRIEVPPGFVTDFASVPRLPLTFALFGEVATAPAAIHDFLYATGTLPRELADAVLLEAMAVTGVSWWRRWPIYAGVRAFGWLFFHGGGKGSRGKARGKGSDP